MWHENGRGHRPVASARRRDRRGSRSSGVPIIVPTHPGVIRWHDDVQLFVGRRPHPMRRSTVDAGREPADTPCRRQQLVDLGEGVPAVANSLHPPLPGRIVERAVGPAELEKRVGWREATQLADVCTEAHGQHAVQPREATAALTLKPWTTSARLACVRLELCRKCRSARACRHAEPSNYGVCRRILLHFRQKPGGCRGGSPRGRRPPTRAGPR